MDYAEFVELMEQAIEGTAHMTDAEWEARKASLSADLGKPLTEFQIRTLEMINKYRKKWSVNDGVLYQEVSCPSVAEAVGLAPAGSSEPMRFPVTGVAEVPDGQLVPILNIKMMPAEKEAALVRQQRAKHPALYELHS